jgi:hypothetical protein
MGLAEFQHILLRLYTDSQFLHEFLCEPENTLNRFVLDERERKTILELPRERLHKWQKELQAKRRNVAENVLRTPDRVVLLSFFMDGPALAWGISPYVRYETITPGMYWLFHGIGRAALPLSPASLLQTKPESGEWTLHDMFRAGKLMYTSGCIGKTVMVI